MKNLKKLSRKQLVQVTGGTCTCMYCYHYNGTGNCYCGSGKCHEKGTKSLEIAH